MGRKARAARTGRAHAAKPAAGPARAAGVFSAHSGILLQQALALHQAGDAEQAADLYRAVLRQSPDNSDALNLYGVLRHQAGHGDEAVGLLERAVEADATNTFALINLGGVLRDLGRFDKAAPYLEKALERLPDSEEAHSNLADVRTGQGRPAEAYRHFEAAARCNPTVSKYHRGMAMSLLAQARPSEAIGCLRRALELNPGRWDLRLNLAEMLVHNRENAEARAILLEIVDDVPPELDKVKFAQALGRLGRWEESEICLRRALDDRPDHWEAKLCLARLLVETGRIDDGKALFLETAESRKEDSVVWNDMGATLATVGRHAEAIECYRKGLEIEPDSITLLTNMGVGYMNLMRFAEGFETFRRVTRIDPEQIAAQVGQCQALQRMKRLDEALVYAHGLRTLSCYNPAYFDSRLCQVVNESCDFDGLEQLQGIWETASKFSRNDLSMAMLTLLALADDEDKQRKLVGLAQRLGEADARRAAGLPLPEPARREKNSKIRLGFVSSDFRNHSVTKCVLPLFHYHDRDRFEIYCYNTWTGGTDSHQHILRGKVHSFVDVHALADREMAEKIRDDNIDILVDLNGWTGMSRLAMFCYRPAPVQATWLGWPLTTGLSAIDYFVVDALTRPRIDGLLVEKPLEIEGSWVCFAGFDNEEIGPPPFERNGFLTFGTLNNVYKYSRPMIAHWAEVLRRFEDSHFMVVRPEARSLLLQNNLINEFASHGVAADRLHFIDNTQRKLSHLAYYNLFDLSLDTYPVTGGTTTMDALWMGVPVVGLSGPAFNNRLCYAILNHCGVGELCADDEAEYLRIAIDLAGDRGRIAEYRRTLRQRMMESPLCRGADFAERFGAAMTKVAETHGLV